MASHPKTRQDTRRHPVVGGQAATEIANHVAAADPHTTYLKESDASSTYATVGHNHSGVYANASHTHAQSDITNLTTDLSGKQATLVSGSNIKTVNSTSLLGSGNLTVGGGYTLHAGGASLSPSDSTTYYCGRYATLAPANLPAYRYIVVPKAGTITAAAFGIGAAGTTGSAENISVYLRHNNTTDYLIETLGAATVFRDFENTSLSISVSAGDTLEFKIVCPAWGINPTSCHMSGDIIVSTS